MFNDIVIGPITIHMYGVMIAAGFLAALLMTLRRGKKRGYDEDIIWGIFFCAIIGGMLGTRILYYIVEIPEIMKDPSILWDFKNAMWSMEESSEEFWQVISTAARKSRRLCRILIW